MFSRAIPAINRIYASNFDFSASTYGRFHKTQCTTPVA